jgi:superfamily II DNA or RNA helicase
MPQGDLAHVEDPHQASQVETSALKTPHTERDVTAEDHVPLDVLEPQKSIEIDQPHFQLRPYQLEAVNAILKARRAHTKRMVVCLPTGAGKTVIFSHLASIARRRVLVLAHREELLVQAQDKLQRTLGQSVRVEIEQAHQRASSEAKVVVASLRSLRPERLSRLMSEEQFGLIIYDECHHAVAEDNQRILRDIGAFDDDFEGTLVGFTATTRRADGIGLEEVFEELVYSRTLKEMISDDYLVPLRGYRISTHTSLEGLDGQGDFPLDALAEKVDIQERNGLVARIIQELARDRRTICFCVTVRHAENLSDSLRQCGVPAGVIHGEMKSSERTRVLKDFRQGVLQVLTNVGVLTEGFDDPEVSCIAMARPTRSESLYVQCVGRGMRLFEGKKDCLVIDFVDLSALNLVTLPTLYGMPVEVDFEGREAGEAAAAYHAILEETPGFEWEAESLTLTQLKERALAFDPLRLRVSDEVRAISQSGWVSLGQRGLALHFSRDGQGFTELVILLTSESGKRRYQILLEGAEVGRASLIEQAVEAADYEVGRMGYLAMDTASMYADWRQTKPPPELLANLSAHRLPRPPQTLEDVFRVLTFYQHLS